MRSKTYIQITIKILVVLSLSALSLSVLSSESYALVYNIAIDKKEPLNATVSVNTHALGLFTLMPPRKHPFVDTYTQPKVTCMKQGKMQIVEYSADIRCEALTWRVAFVDVSHTMHDVSQQDSIYHSNGWWSLVEWNNLVRLKAGGVLLDAQLCEPMINSCKAIPDSTQPPLVFTWGKHRAKVKIADVKFTLYSDVNLSEHFGLAYQDTLSHQYQYLSRLTNNSSAPSDIDIVWLSRSCLENNNLGGFAGASAYMANFCQNTSNGSAVNEQEERNRLFWISGHEVFHMLVSYEFPLWVSESLAHYYGYKSLSQTQVKLEKTPKSYWDLSKEGYRDKNVGLYIANTQVVKHRNYDYYGLFYDKGAYFWFLLDEMLADKDHNLDDYIQYVGNDNEGTLSNTFIQKIEAILGKEKFAELSEKFLSH